MIEEWQETHKAVPDRRLGRERVMLGYFAVIALAAGSILGWAHSQPHAQASSESESGPVSTAELTPSQATAHFLPSDIAQLRTIVQDTLTKVRAGDASGATTRIKDLETAWDDGQPTLQPLDDTAWHFLDGEIDASLTAVRNSHATASDKDIALATLLMSLGG